MRFRTSCFNPGLAGNIWRRLWPLPLAVLLVVLMTPGLQIYSAVRDAAAQGLSVRVQQIHGQMAAFGCVNWMLVLLDPAAFLAAALVFRHLHSRKELQFLHALPVSRRCLYLTGYCTVLGLIALPILLGLLLCMLEAAALGVGAAVAPELCKVFLAGIPGLLVFSALAVISCVLAGQTLGAVLIYGGINCAVFVILGGAGEIGALLMPGIQLQHSLGPVILWLTPLYRLLDAAETVTESVSIGEELWSVPLGFTHPGILALCGGIGLLLAGAGLWLYEIRRGENTGEMIAFGPVRTVCKVLGTLVAAVAGPTLLMLLGLWTEEVSVPMLAGAVLLFAALGYLAAEMIVQRTLRVFRAGTLRSCGILLAVVLAVLIAARMDVLGRVSHVPEPETVESVTLDYSMPNQVALSPEDAWDLHRQVLDHRELLVTGAGGTYRTLILNYQLKNGRSLYREYNIRAGFLPDTGIEQENPLGNAVYALLRKPDYCYQVCFGDPERAPSLETLDHGELTAYSYWPEDEEEYGQPFRYLNGLSGDYQLLTTAQSMELYDAVCRDIQAGRVSPQGDFPGRTEEQVGRIYLNWYAEPYTGSPGGYDAYIRSTDMLYGEVDLTPEMTETLKVLAGMGITLANR